jgi:uncharacterized protein YutE (UPF0331/DUF86 family)/predicted nucleotidyltransferase
MIAAKDLIEKLSSFFVTRDDIAFAFLFGSWAKERPNPNSDIDVAVYFYSENHELEVEDDVFFDEEDAVWADVDRISGVETDLLVLNRAPVRVGYTAITEGVSLCISDKALFWKYVLTAGRLFEEYAEFTESYLEIKARSSSLSDTDRDRLLRSLDFLQSELEDISQFRDLDFKRYSEDSSLRRNVERWIENLVNASIDIAKVLVSSEKQPIPQTYRETILRLQTVSGFDNESIDSLSRNVRLRNILAHEYLDIRYKHILLFIQNASNEYRHLIDAAREFLSNP